jgi:hypothetical protein
MDMDAPIRVDQPYGCREAGNAGANDMGGLLHQMNA